MPVFQRLASPTTEAAAYSKKHLPTFPFLAESFRVLMSLSNFLFVNEVFSFLFRSSFHGFCSTVKETGDAIDTTRQVARMLRTHTHTVTHVRTGDRRTLQTTHEAQPRWACRRLQAGGSGSSGDTAEFCWSSVISAGLS